MYTSLRIVITFFFCLIKTVTHDFIFQPIVDDIKLIGISYLVNHQQKLIKTYLLSIILVIFVI